MKKTLSLFSFIILTPLANADNLIDGGDPSEILAVARDFGEASLTRDDADEPIIFGFLGDLYYGIGFFGCSEEDDCDDIVLYSFMVFEKPPSLKRVNAWNQSHRVGKLELDGAGDLVLSVPIILEGGITRTNLKRIFEIYMVMYMLVERQFPEGTRVGSDD